MKTIIWSIVGCATLVGVLNCAAELKIEEKVVGPPWQPGTLLTLSQTGMRVASTHQKDGKQFVMIDGVESQPYDDVLLAVPTIVITYQNTGAILGVDITERGPVAFSADGKRYAYAARLGDAVIVILDGKEIFRAKHSLSAPPVALMQFSPDGQHLYFYHPSGDTMQSYRLMEDGKPVTPAFDQTPPLLFSEDGSRWLLHAGKAKQPGERMIIIDGKVAEYTGEMPRFSPDGKQVICIAKTDGEHRLLVDGKPILTRKGEFIDSFKVGANGDTYAIIKRGAGQTDLYRNGKLVENASGAWYVVLSPDGKRWAAHGMSNLGAAYWVVLDGKKGPDFKTVDGIMFSPDSTVCIYRGERDDGWHLLTNGVEDPKGYPVLRPAFAKTGHSLVYAAGSSPMALTVFHKGKASPQHRNVFTLEISPNGERIAYHAPIDPTTAEFIVDGEVKGYGGAFGDIAVFSPDSQHIAARARTAKSGTTLWVDGTFLPDSLPFNVPSGFTPDNRHLIGVNIGSGSRIYYLDGEPVAEFTTRSIKWVNSPKMVRQVRPVIPFGVNPTPPDPNAVDWEAQPDGSIVFVGCAPDPGPQGIGPLKRIKVTSDAGTTFATWVGGAEAAHAKALAEVEAARLKAAEEAAAAKQKVAEEAAAAAAKRKADYDAAVAAKTKAREDAIKLKTLNIQRAKQGLSPLKELPE